MKEISIRNSIATKIFKSSFSIYFIITLIVTLLHMFSEYYIMKNDLNKELISLQKVFEPILSQSLWRLDKSEWESTIIGMMKNDILIGVKLFDKNKLICGMGKIKNENRVYEFDNNDEKNSINKKNSMFYEQLIEHNFKLKYFVQGKEIDVGSASFYSSSSIVLQKIKISYLIIILNAIIKTIALWSFFIWAGKRLLSKPLAALTVAASKINLDNLTEIKTNIKSKEKNELNLLEDSLNQMINNLKLSINERNKAEYELRRVKNFLQSTIDSMPSAIIGVDENLCINKWNPQAELLTGINRNDAINKNLDKIVPFLKSKIDIIKKSIKKQRPYIYEKIKWDIKESENILNITIYPIKDYEVQGAIIRADNVTEKYKIEEMLVQSEKMLSVGGLAAGMAHEINNPLSGIMQTIQVMNLRFNKDLPKNKKLAIECDTSIEAIHMYMTKKEIFKMIDSILEAGRRAAKIIENMLNFSRKSESKFASHNINILIEKTIELANNDYDLKKKYDFRKIEIIRQYDENIKMILCEETKIQQVIFNILKNGSQAMSEVNDIKPKFVISTWQDQNMVYFAIKDNGPGLNENNRKRIFEPFFTTKPVGIGTGLGLSVSYFIITENHGGNITVESNLGKGTTFIVSLPTFK